MSTNVHWGDALHADPAVYLPHPDATGNAFPTLGVGIDGAWVGHDQQGPDDWALTFDLGGDVGAITGTLEELRHLADQIHDAITDAEEQYGDRLLAASDDSED